MCVSTFHPKESRNLISKIHLHKKKNSEIIQIKY